MYEVVFELQNSSSTSTRKADSTLPPQLSSGNMRTLGWRKKPPPPPSRISKFYVGGSKEIIELGEGIEGGEEGGDELEEEVGNFEDESKLATL